MRVQSTLAFPSGSVDQKLPPRKNQKTLLKNTHAHKPHDYRPKNEFLCLDEFEFRVANSTFKNVRSKNERKTSRRLRGNGVVCIQNGIAVGRRNKKDVGAKYEIKKWLIRASARLCSHVNVNRDVVALHGEVGSPLADVIPIDNYLR